MFARGLAWCSIFALATVAQEGVVVQIVPTPNLPLYPPGSVVQVDVKLSQAPGGSDQRLRLVEFDTQITNSFLALSLPLTHTRGTPGTGDDIYFWSFSSLPVSCPTPTSSGCGLDHYVDDDLPAGPVDTRANILSIAFHALTTSAANQLLLLGNGTPVTVGKIQVTLPPSAGTYTLNMMNAGDQGSNRGARVDFGFDLHIIWRARSAAPNDVTGGTLTFEVCAGNPCPPPPPSFVAWESVLTHSPNQPVPIALAIPDTGLFSEPRSGIKKIVVTFDAPLNPTTVIPANVTICGNNDVTGAGISPVDLSGVVITTATTSGDTKMEINFAPGLPNYARYRIALKTSILAANGAPIQADSRILTALQGDASGDRRVGATDVGGVRSLVGINPINPATLNEVRSDAFTDGRINATDVGGVRSKVGNDARAILDPICP